MVSYKWVWPVIKHVNEPYTYHLFFFLMKSLSDKLIKYITGLAVKNRCLLSNSICQKHHSLIVYTIIFRILKYFVNTKLIIIIHTMIRPIHTHLHVAPLRKSNIDLFLQQFQYFIHQLLQRR